MSLQKVSYMEVLSLQYPNIKAEATGDGSDYDGITWISGDPLPSKAQLDLDRDYHTHVRVWLAIKEKRDFLQGNGVKVGANWFHSDVNSRVQQLGLVMFAGSLPPGIMWKTMNGAFVPMTQTLAVQIFQSSAASDMAIFAAAERHKALMMASVDPTAYDFSGGWPATYTGSLLL
jgi:hypothetical protein